LQPPCFLKTALAPVVSGTKNVLGLQVSFACSFVKMPNEFKKEAIFSYLMTLPTPLLYC
jgi:hypothetical protein